MKNLKIIKLLGLILGASLISIGSAIACPNLTGLYLCQDKKDSTKNYAYHFEQSENKGITTYQGDYADWYGSEDFNWIADDVTRVVTTDLVDKKTGDKLGTLTTKTVAICAGDILFINKDYYGTSTQGNFSGYERSYFSRDQADLKVESKKVYADITGKTKVIERNDICQRDL